MKPVYMTEERLLAGVRRLLTQVEDLVSSGARHIAVSPVRAEARDPYRKLYARYRKELVGVLAEAIPWWEGRTRTFTKELGSAKQARLANWKEFPAGPAADPYTIAVVRKYWLKCAALNDAAAPAERVAPEAMLLQWLIDDADWKSAEILSAMPYWPVGLDAEGYWT